MLVVCQYIVLIIQLGYPDKGWCLVLCLIRSSGYILELNRLLWFIGIELLINLTVWYIYKVVCLRDRVIA